MILKNDFEAKLILAFSSFIEEENKIYSEEKVKRMLFIYLKIMLSLKSTLLEMV